MPMTVAERAQYDKLKYYMQVCEKFTCSCCNRATAKKDFDDVYVWRPKDAMTRKLVSKSNRCAVYVLCRECSRLPEKESRPKIEATLAKNGLFG